jgi:hypothetical protein
MWQIEDVDGVETWVEVEMSDSHRRHFPSRLESWKRDHEKYKRAKGALINNLINSIDESLQITLMNQPTYNEIAMKSNSIDLWKLIAFVMLKKSPAKFQNHLKVTLLSVGSHN